MKPREIKFRAWDKHHKVMLSVLSLKFQENKDVSGSCEKYDSPIVECPRFQWGTVSMSGPNHCACDDLILMQYTGLKDKNGKEIFEGDIVEYEWYDDHGQWGEDKRSGPVVVEPFYWTGFLPFVHWNNYVHSLKKCQIIGNIYENPELLK